LMSMLHCSGNFRIIEPQKIHSMRPEKK